MRQISKEIKENQGTYEPSKEAPESVNYNKYEINPVAPREWPANIQKIWYDRCNDLKTAGYLMKAFIPGLRRYCFAIYQAEEAEKALLNGGFTTIEIGTEGQQYEVVSKWVAVLDNANKTIERIGAKYGFTPLDVQKIPAVKKEDTPMSLLK